MLSQETSIEAEKQLSYCGSIIDSTLSYINQDFLNISLSESRCIFERPRLKVKIGVSKDQSVFLKNCSTFSETLISLVLHCT